MVDNKGGKRPGAGRPKGSPNKSSAKARAAIADFMDANAHRLQDWLDKIEKEQGAHEAAKFYASLMEYHVPKLARSEVTGADGERLMPTTITIQAGSADSND